MIRIAMIAGTLDRGGAEKQLFLMARSLREAGADVRVYALTRGEPYESRLRDAGIPVEAVGGGALPPLRLLSLVAALRRFRPHVIQACHTFVNLYAALAAKAVGAISIGALRSTIGHSRRANGAWTPLLLSAPDALIVNSSKAAAELEHGRGTRTRPIFVVPNVVEVPGPPPERPDDGMRRVTVAFVGRLIPVKRLDLFLEALALARNESPRLVAIVAGDGPERAGMEALAARLGLGSAAVTFLGTTDAAEKLLARADILVLSSDEEGFPNVVLEAMAAAVPVVTTRAGDAGIVVEEGRTGFVVPTGDARALARRISDLANSATLRHRLGNAGYERAREEYGPAPLAHTLFSVYRRVAEKTNHRRTVVALG